MPIKIKRPILAKKYKFDDIRFSDNFANQLKVGIIKRTQKGKDSKDSKFKPYSRAYAKAKSYTKTVNLTAKGTMLHSISHKARKNKLFLFFGATIENTKAYANQVVNKRHFFGIDKRQIILIKKYIIKLF